MQALTAPVVLLVTTLFLGVDSAANHRQTRQAVQSPLFCTLPNGITGICTAANTCQLAGSTVVGLCGQTRLMCCQAVRTCDSTISMTNSHFVHPHFPATVNDQARCSATILRPLASICQIRVDFIDFMLRQPTNGECSPDHATFTGTPTPVPPLCGNMTGQHLYLDFQSDNTPMRINIHGDGRIARSWNLKFTYVSCLDKAPRGCLQYYKQSSGTICSLNYKGNVGATHDAEFVPVRVNKNRILGNLSYSTCIRPIRGDICGIRYQVNDNFHVSDRTGAGSSTECSGGENHIVIPSGQAISQNRVTKGGPYSSMFCGRNLNPDGADSITDSRIYSRLQPFVVGHVTGPNHDPEATLNGYCLNYQQVDCQNQNGAMNDSSILAEANAKMIDEATSRVIDLSEAIILP